MSGSKNSHFKLSESPISFSVKFGRCQRQVKSFKNECFQAAREVGLSTEKPIALLCSGGSESEIMALSFKESGVKFECFMHKFSQGENEADVEQNRVWAKTHRIAMNYIDYDIRDFFASGRAMDIAMNYHCPSVELLHTLELYFELLMAGYYPVVGSNERHLLLKNGKWYSYEVQPLMAFLRLLKLEDASGSAGFWIWSPELMLSFYQSEFIQKEFLLNPKPEKGMTRFSKYDFYHNEFKIQKRPKLDGFENLGPMVGTYRKKLQKLRAVYNNIALAPIGQYLKDLQCNSG